MGRIKAGFIYVISNPSIRGKWVKIGKATDWQQRIRSLNTGAPDDCVPHAIFATADMDAVETQIHHQIKTLRGERYARKEWFSIDFDTAVAALRNIAVGRREIAGLVEYREGLPFRQYDRDGKPRRVPFSIAPIQHIVFHLKTRRATAEMSVVQGGCRVAAGATVLPCADGFCKTTEYPIRQKLEGDYIANGVLIKPYTFSSASTAASVLMGRSENGRTFWVTDAGEPFGKFVPKGFVW